MIAIAWAGYKPPKKKVAPSFSADDPSGIGQMIAMFPNGVVPAQG